MTKKKGTIWGKQTILQWAVLGLLLVGVVSLAALVLTKPPASEGAPFVELGGTIEEANAKPTGTLTGGAVLSPSPSASPSIPPQDTPAPSKTPAPTVAPTLEPTPEPTPKPTPKPTPAPTEKAPSPTPAPTEKPTQSSQKPLSGKVIGIDPGHQAHPNREQEPIAPGSSKTKDKVSSGTYGRFTGVREYEVTLQVGLKLKDMLEDLGATVVMTRTKNDVDISNVERAKLFNKAKVDLGVRLHCNGSDDPDVHGAFMLVPKSKEYPYYEQCVRAAKKILAAYGEATGISVKKGITYRDDQTGFNWCERPTVNIEMGHMTNKDEDYKLTDKAFQTKMAEGIKNGILAYFGD